MSIENAIASLAVDDSTAASAWYRALLGRPADSTPMPGVAEWRFPRGGWLQVHQLAQRAGNGSVTLAVDDIDDVAAHVERLGLGVMRRTSSPQARTLTIVDPDGNHVTFAQALDPTLAR